MEPATSTASATAASVGLAALLAGAFGNVAADVMMVVLASIAGAYISLSGASTGGYWRPLQFMFGAVLTSLVLAWALAFVAGRLTPAFDSPYTPTVIAFLIGSNAKRLRKITGEVTERFEKGFRGTP